MTADAPARAATAGADSGGSGRRPRGGGASAGAGAAAPPGGAGSGPAASPPSAVPGRAVVEATLALLRARARGADADPPAVPVLEILDFARAQRVLWPVCAALERVLPAPAAALLLRPAMAEREARARALAAQLRDLAARLSAAGLSPVALKGAAALAEAGGETGGAGLDEGGGPGVPGGAAGRPDREMLDLDLLLPEGEVVPAARVLMAAGYAGEAEAFVATDYHFPALFPPAEGPAAGVATVELHRRPGWARRGPLAGLEDRAAPSALAGMGVPSREDRLAHLVHHAQIADRGHARRLVRLRDLVEWRELLDGPAGGAGGRGDGDGDGGDGGSGAGASAFPAAPELERLAARFDAAGQGAAFRAFAALACRVWERPAPAGWAAAHRAWGEAALAALADAREAERRRRRDRLPAALAALVSPWMLAHIGAGAFNRARRRRFLRRLGGG